MKSLTRENIFIGYDPPTPDGVVIHTPPEQLSSLTSSLRVENLPWNLFKREIESRGISQQFLVANQSSSSNTGVPTDGQLSPFNSLLTDFQRPETSNADTLSFLIPDSSDLLNPDLWDWTMENCVTHSSLFDTAFSPTTNQTGLVTSSSNVVTISPQSALSFFSELSLWDWRQDRHDTSELAVFIKRHIVDEKDLEFGTSSSSILIPSNHSVLFRFFNLFIFLTANNLLIPHDIAKVLTWTMENDYTWIITRILELPSTAIVDVFATKIFPAAVKAGEIELVRRLISRGIDVQRCRNKWETPLSLAVQRRDIKMVDLLCGCGAKPEILEFSILGNDQNNNTLWSHDNTQLLSLLLSHGANPEAFICDKPRGFPLISAASKGGVEAVQLLLGANARTDFAIIDFGTALQAAAARGHEAVVRVLVEAGAGVNTIWAMPNSDYFRPYAPQGSYAAVKTPIQLAACGDHPGIVQILLQSGALVNYSPGISYLGLCSIDYIFSRWIRFEYDEEAPLGYAIQYAAVNKNIALVQQLLAAGANVNSRIGTNYGDTPLQTAARLGDVTMTRILLSKNADVNAPPGKYNGRTAIQAAAENGNIEIIQILISAKADINAAAGWRKGRTAIQAAMERGHHQVATMLLHLGADINAIPAFSGGLTALQAAAVSGDLEMLKTALLYQADVKAPVGPENGVTALQAVIKQQNALALKILLEAGADVNEQPSKESDSLRDERGSNMTALQYAASTQWLTGAQYLIDCGADIDMLPPHPNYDAYTALGCAIDNYDHAMIRLLLHNGADPNTPAMNYEGAPSAFLHALSRCCSNEIFELFLRKGADVTNCWGTKSALEVAVSDVDADLNVVERVMKMTSQLPESQYLTAMKRVLAQVTADFGYPPDFDLVKMLLDAGADIDAIDIDTGETLLQKTLAEPDLDVVKLLLERGANVNIPATDSEGTPLQKAILYEEPEIAGLLIEYGADVNAFPAKKDGATALQAAAIHGYYGLALRLLECGADVAAAAAPIYGRTAIDGAAENGRLDMLQLLLNACEDREDLPLVCSHAASLAETEGHVGIANWLKAYTIS